MTIDGSILKLVPPDQHDVFTENVNEIVIESFVFMADRDYLTARFAFFQNQDHLFLWSAAQALEKYLKANILLLGSGKVFRKHNHSSLASDLKGVNPGRLDIDLKAPIGWSDQGVKDWPEMSASEFLLIIQKHGSPNVRYDQVDTQIHLSYLVFLDRIAFSLRSGLVAESVQDCRLVGEELKQCFFDLNYSFAPLDYVHRSLLGLTLYHVSTSRLVRALKGGYGHAKAYQKWAGTALDMEKYVKHVVGH